LGKRHRLVTTTTHLSRQLNTGTEGGYIRVSGMQGRGSVTVFTLHTGEVRGRFATDESRWQGFLDGWVRVATHRVAPETAIRGVPSGDDIRHAVDDLGETEILQGLIGMGMRCFVRRIVNAGMALLADLRTRIHR